MTERPDRRREMIASDEPTLLEDEIRRQRAALAGSIEALERKAMRASDWRYQFAQRPLAGLAVAMIGGAALAWVVFGDGGDRADGSGGGSSLRWKTALQSAIVGAVSREVSAFLRGQLSVRR